MTAFFFGPEGQRLYGYHHAPNVPVASPAGVVLCPPWGSEYEYAHRSLLVLARRLAGAGRHVLRFDYSGTGDSWGETSEADLSRWVHDAASACEELRAAAGVSEVDVVGLRVGAAVAARLARVRSDVRRVLLWDPITDGARWVAQRRGSGTGPTQLDRTRVSTSFLEQFGAVDLSFLHDLPAARTLFLRTTGDDAESERSEVERRGPGIAYQTLEQPSPWVMDHSIWTGQVPMGAVREIVEWLA